MHRWDAVERAVCVYTIMINIIAEWRTALCAFGLLPTGLEDTALGMVAREGEKALLIPALDTCPEPC